MTSPDYRLCKPASTEALDEAMEADGAHGPPTFRNEYVGVCGVIAPQLTKRPHLVTPDRMYAWETRPGQGDEATRRPELVRYPESCALAG